MKAEEVLKQKLIGSYFNWFSLGDNWTISFCGYYIVAQNIEFEDEKLLNDLIFKNYPLADSTVDKEFISKSAIMAILKRREVTNVHLDDKARLAIEFEHKHLLTLSTNETIVDWQWALNKTGAEPYIEYIIACFWEGQIEVNEELVNLD